MTLILKSSLSTNKLKINMTVGSLIGGSEGVLILDFGPINTIGSSVLLVGDKGWLDIGEGKNILLGISSSTNLWSGAISRVGDRYCFDVSKSLNVNSWDSNHGNIDIVLMIADVVSSRVERSIMDVSGYGDSKVGGILNCRCVIGR